MIFRVDTAGTDPNDMALVMRGFRAMLLEGSDWTQMPDSPLTDEQRQAWATYRQALRDFPSIWTPAETAEFPDPPEAN